VSERVTQPGEAVVVEPGGTIAAPAGAPSRVHLAWFLVPMALVFASAQVGRAIWPSLLDSAPWSLLLLSSNWTRLLMVQPLVPAALFFALAIGRIMLLAPLYYGFGREYGDAALRWGERKLGTSGRYVVTVERYFRRFGLLIVAVWWSVFICLLAGATGMRARVFFPVLFAGTVARVTLIYFVGDALSDPITEIARFVSRYALIITPITIALTALQLWYGRRRNRGLSLDDLEDLEGGFEETEAELGGEATVTSPREPD
jgi:membrane protein DedA with SNARE-associated domain